MLRNANVTHIRKWTTVARKRRTQNTKSEFYINLHFSLIPIVVGRIVQLCQDGRLQPVGAHSLHGVIIENIRVIRFVVEDESRFGSALSVSTFYYSCIYSNPKWHPQSRVGNRTLRCTRLAFASRIIMIISHNNKDENKRNESSLAARLISLLNAFMCVSACSDADMKFIYFCEIMFCVFLLLLLLPSINIAIIV